MKKPTTTPTERHLLLAVKRLVENQYVTQDAIPEFPLVLTGTAVDTAVVLEWSPIASLKPIRYQVYRGVTDVFSDSTLIATIAEQGTIAMRSFSDIADQVPEDTLYYWVRAIDDADEGPISNLFTIANPTIDTGGGSPLGLPFNGILGDGRHGTITISTNTNADVEIPIYQLEELTIEEGATWTALPQHPGGFIISVLGRCTIAGTINAAGIGGARGLGTSDVTFAMTARAGHAGFGLAGSGGGGGVGSGVGPGGQGGPLLQGDPYGGHNAGGQRAATPNSQWHVDSTPAEVGHLRSQSGLYLVPGGLAGFPDVNPGYAPGLPGLSAADNISFGQGLDVAFNTLWAFYNKSIWGAGGGGGAGGGDGTHSGGDGGNGGGYCIIMCNELDFPATGSIIAYGAGGSDGEPAVGVSATGGGGGGGGGCVLIGYRSPTGLISNDGSIDVSGGLGGAAQDPGSGDGGDGGAGFSKVFEMRV